MFQFTTTTIVNDLTDFSTGLDLLKATGTKEAGSADANSIFPANSLQIKRHLTFLKDNVLHIYKRAATDPQLAQATVDLSGITDPGIYRIAMYVRLQGSNNELYANDYVFKGKPFFIEFTKKSDSETAAQLATRVVKIAKKYQHMMYDHTLLKFSNSGAVVTIDATDEFQLFLEVELQQFDETAGIQQSCCANSGDFVTIDTIDADSPAHQGNVVLVHQGVPGFGTYRQIIKDLRLPTPDNRRWMGIIQDETPVYGNKYDQYTIIYCKKVGVQGMDHVGDIVTAETSHIFFVNHALQSDWETALAKIGTIEEVVNNA